MIFAKALRPTPLLNTPHFSTVFSHPLPLCDQGLLRPIECIALPGTPFHIIGQESACVYRVATPSYPADTLFVDGRFLTFSKHPFPNPTPSLPPPHVLLETLYSRVGLPYIWGGNWSRGIPELLNFYPPARPLSPKEHIIHTLQGVDCSGLLYEATSGFTPRNTSELLFYGTGLSIAGKSYREIAQVLHPLDLIVWKGHVIIAGKSGEVIESHRLYGTVVTNAEKRLSEIMETKQPVDEPTPDPKTFVIRRIAL